MSGTKGYSTCALYIDDGAEVNPFSLGEYQAQCGASSKQPVSTVCVAPPPAHIPADALAACALTKKDGANAYVMDDACVQALRKVADVHGHRKRAPTDPVFAEADMCRTKLNGDFRIMCGTKEVTYDDMREARGAKCDECCSSVLQRYEAKAKGSSATHPTKPEHKHRPAYIPF